MAGHVAVGVDEAHHGGAGAGAVPGLATTAEDFPEPADMITWVALGSAGYQAAGIEEYAPGKPVAGGMPAWADSLTAEELMSVVLHERVSRARLGGSVLVVCGIAVLALR